MTCIYMLSGGSHKFANYTGFSHVMVLENKNQRGWDLNVLEVCWFKFTKISPLG